MNLPNKLTTVRIFAVPIYTAVMLLPIVKSTKSIIVAILFSITAITDFFDGYIARSRNLVTDFGKFLDPVADKVMIFGAYCGLIYMYRDDQTFFICLIISAFIFFFREISVTAMRMIVGSKGKVVAAESSGKIKTFSQIVFVISALTEDLIFPDCTYIISYITLAFMTLMTVISGVIYFRRYYEYLMPDR